MPKIELELVKRILQRNQLEVRKVAEIMEELTTELEVEAAQKEERPPPVKKQYAILVSDPERVLDQKDLTGWVVQIPEEDSPYTAPERIIRAAYEFNATPKGRRLPLESIGEACEVVPAKMAREQQIWIRTKEPVLLVRTDNSIPKSKDPGG